MNYIIFDISRYQGTMDFAKAKAKGILGAVIRATVGDYYQDTQFNINWDDAGKVGMYRTAYHVITPEITANAQITNLFKFMGSRRPAWPFVLDCELDRGQDEQRITAVIQESARLIEQLDGRKPIIYTRQTWWDAYVLKWSGWKDYPLWAARYINGLTGPWSDGACKFRDWDRWLIWQQSANGNKLGPDYGASGSKDIDLDIFNGTVEQFVAFCGGTVAPDPTPTPTPTPTPAPTPDEYLHKIYLPEVDKFLRTKGYAGPGPEGS